MPGFGTAFEHRQPVPGVGNAQQQVGARLCTAVNTDDIDTTGLQCLARVLLIGKGNDLHLQAQELSDQSGCIGADTFVQVILGID
ncbi:hypothetical protein D3C80_855010 [compost metagenome]